MNSLKSRETEAVKYLQGWKDVEFPDTRMISILDDVDPGVIVDTLLTLYSDSKFKERLVDLLYNFMRTVKTHNDPPTYKKDIEELKPHPWLLTFWAASTGGKRDALVNEIYQWMMYGSSDDTEQGLESEVDRLTRQYYMQAAARAEYNRGFAKADAECEKKIEDALDKEREKGVNKST